MSGQGRHICEDFDHIIAEELTYYITLLHSNQSISKGRCILERVTMSWDLAKP